MGCDPRIELSKKTQQELERRTEEALKKRHSDFRIEHENDTQEQLLEYIRKCAKELGRSPSYGEVIGCAFIHERFGNWGQALKQAGLPPAGVVRIKPQNLLIYRKEFKHQSKLHQASKSEQRQQKMQQKAARREAHKQHRAEKQTQDEANTEEITT